MYKASAERGGGIVDGGGKMPCVADVFSWNTKKIYCSALVLPTVTGMENTVLVPASTEREEKGCIRQALITSRVKSPATAARTRTCSEPHHCCRAMLFRRFAGPQLPKAVVTPAVHSTVGHHRASMYVSRREGNSIS